MNYGQLRMRNKKLENANIHGTSVIILFAAKPMAVEKHERDCLENLRIWRPKSLTLRIVVSN